MAQAKQKLTKNQKRRLKKKQQKKEQREKKLAEENKPISDKPPPPPKEEDVEVQYVSAQNAIKEDDPSMAEFAAIFDKFASAESLCGTQVEDPEAEKAKADEAAAKKDADEEEDSDSDDDDKPKMSRKQRKKLKRLSVAELKQLVARPDKVEAHDVTAADPRLLVFLKRFVVFRMFSITGAPSGPAGRSGSWRSSRGWPASSP